MILFWIMYLLGYIATVLLLYFTLEKGTKITVAVIAAVFTMSVFSWAGFIVSFLFIYADKVIFTKK